MTVRSLPRFIFTGRFLQILLHLPEFAKLYWRLFWDRRVPLLAKAELVSTFVYLASPIDLVPFFIPFFGQMDDLVVVLGGLWLFVRLCPPEIVRERVREIADGR